MFPHLNTFLAVILVHSSDGAFRVDPLVNTNIGLIRGVRADDGDYSMFLGIPYGQINASNPFGKATPQEPFDDVYEADDDSAMCPQVEEFTKTIMGTLDCLHLNVYVPTAANSRNPKSVLVWIYGGGFRFGSAGRYLYGPKYLVRHDIILVTLNYRLGPYGFMNLESSENPGNEGIKDQLLAMRWIKYNIEAFGGDPNSITLFGESAGGISVDFHILSGQEKLFDKAIIQSGTSFLPLFTEPDKDSPLILAKHLGFATENINEAIAFLATVETKLLIAASSDLGLNFYPYIEKSFEGVESVISEDWTRAEVPKVKNMPILIGFNEHEQLYRHFDSPPASFENFNIIRDKLNLHFDIDSPDFEGMEDLMRRFYLGDDEINYNKLMEIVDFDSDYTFNYPTYRSIARFLDNDAGNIFFYVFSYVGDRNVFRRRSNITTGGAVHADELGYLFDISFFDETPTENDQLTIDRITTLWANFVNFGTPTPETSDLLPLHWQPIKKDSPYHYLELGAELEMKTRPFHERMSFLDLFYRANDDILQSFGSESDVVYKDDDM